MVIRPCFSAADVLLVAEHSTEWGRWMDVFEERGTRFNAIIQGANESLAAFARRVTSRIGVLATQRRLPPTIVLVNAPTGDAPSATLRRAIACALAGRLTQIEGGRIVLAGDPQVASDVAFRYGTTVSIEHADRVTTAAPMLPLIAPDMPLPAA